jgi:predicted amidohydrolase
MKPARSLAAAQTTPIRGDVAANSEDHLRLIRIAAEAGAHVLVFPELSLTGYELDLAAGLAFSEDDARLGPLVESAAEHDTILVVGAPVRLDDRLHIGAFLLMPDRSIELYTKQRLGAFPPDVNPGGSVPPAEATIFQPGDRNPLVRWSGQTAAVAICADIGRPTHAEAAAARGARNYLASTFVIPADFESDVARLRKYAVDHSMVVVFSNYGSPSGGLPAAGRSGIVSEKGDWLVQLPASGAGIAVAIEEDGGWRTKTIPR